MNTQDNLSSRVNIQNGTAVGSNTDNVSGQLEYGNRLSCNATNTDQAQVGNINRSNVPNSNVGQSDNYVINPRAGENHSEPGIQNVSSGNAMVNVPPHGSVFDTNASDDVIIRVLHCTVQLQYRDFRCTVTVTVNPNSQKLQINTVPVLYSE